MIHAGSSIAFVGNYLPRRCGIATFTHDLCEAVALQAKDNYDVFTVAINDKPEGYPYPPRVRFEIRQNTQADYRLAAEFLNMNQVSAVCLQHEYGIFGGTYGSHLLSMLRRLRRPLVTTFHTILKDPLDEQKLILQEIARLSGRVVVMADIARDFLKDIYGVPDEKIAVIPHGIPDVPFVDPHFFKDQFG
ncbi:MAG: glycosyltransferase, partial [Phycisphaerae bacterium]|nr:glycosyltransferase [Phycisphaerae bacterium]